MNDSPATNRAQRWFRRLLWLVPTVIVFASLFGFTWLADRVGWLDRHSHSWIPWAVAVLLTFGVGVYEAMLRWPSNEESKKGRIEDLLFEALVFLIVQSCCVVPLLLGLTGMIFYFIVIFLELHGP